MSARRGMSLVEVVVTIIILGLAIPPLTLQIGAAARQQELVVVQQLLTQLAEQRLGEIFADRANPIRGYDYITAANYPDEGAPWGLTGYARTTEFREVASTDFTTAQAGTGIRRFRIVTTGPGGQSFIIESFVTNVAAAAGP